MKFKYIVPSFYGRFFPKTFWSSSLVETKATCQQCIQSPKKYKEDLKCCTFWPFIPNYVVGQILLSKEAKYQEAQQVILNHIQKRHWNLPIGLVAPGDYQMSFKKNKKKVFGQDSDFLCPYYSKKNNNCGLWLYRGSVCTSFFCESSYGKSGHEFWHLFENYFSYLEMGLSQEVLVYKDFSPRDVTDQLDFLMVQEKIKFSAGRYKKIWKHFHGQEKDFYIQAARFVDEMPTSQVKEILGETGSEIKKQMVEALKKAKA